MWPSVFVVIADFFRTAKTDTPEKEPMSTTQKLHAMLSPSGSKKWMTCIGSVALEADMPDDTSEYADEGTAAHELASRCLTHKEHPTRYLGTVLTIVNGVYWPGDPTPRPAKLTGKTDDVVRTFEVTIDMVAHVNSYVQRVQEYATLGTLAIEQRLPIGHITGEDGATGTGDAVVLIEDNPVGEDEIQVHDLKFGMGVQVFAERNPQMMIYAGGAIQKWLDEHPDKPLPFKNVRMVIHQPRLNHLDEWDCSVDELMLWLETASARARDVMIAYEHRANWIGKDNDYLTPGDHCSTTFCKARATCPALAKFVQEKLGADFEELNTPVNAEHSKTPEMKAHAERQYFMSLIPADPHELATKFRAIDIIADWCKAVRAKAEAMLFEHNNSAEIIDVLGIKLVQGKQGNRQWVTDDEAEALLKKMRLKTEEIYDMSVKSPTSIEKLLKAEPKRWARVEPLITRKPGQPSVAPKEDKRPALVMAPPADDFDVLPAAVDCADLV